MTEGGGFAQVEQQEKKTTLDLNIGMNCVAGEAFGWFVMELLKAKEEEGILYLFSWQGRSILTEETGRVVSSPEPGDGPEKEFELTVVSDGKARAAKLAQEADYAVVCGGNHPLRCV